MIITRYDTHPIPYGVGDQVIQLVADNVTELSLGAGEQWNRKCT
ncbi:hypothetical protein BV360_05170 [Pseudomonas syringae pv. actinidiae]|nr:GNAT family acetyltransferase [Pseudomonas syringae pv. actinidiae]AYL84394.1 GNAT family acetyltransferase [Pseudomonas syringae pv. actinidiae str. Shaanxi_M228]EPN74796.1 GNAT acetyltransferase [Pseudomonas syringae pv. actinidiae ICMP 18801]EPN82356.1 GNAT acetyltransferase [Pseudomonas syringae pv. actinidiae ICMP 19097]AQX68480.1 GNAT family acetyltransferase [Pseudomonas syringae pv. actinidiae]